jgi:biotin carboxyl carrier protein
MYRATIDEDREVEVELSENGEQGGRIDGDDFSWDLLKVKRSSFHVIRDGRSYRIDIVRSSSEDKHFSLIVNGQEFEVGLKDRYDLLLERLGMEDLQGKRVENIKAPMPGKVLDIKVSVGSEVSEGDPLLVLEAMKMENVIKAPGEGKVKTIHVDVSDPVEKNAVLVEFE